MRKTKLIALLLAVAMITSMAVPVAADPTPVTSTETRSSTTYTKPDPTTVKCPCADCNGAVPDWQEWTKDEETGNWKTHGHYYISDGTGDITLTAGVKLGGSHKLVLNLNGNDVKCGGSGTNFRLESAGAFLDIMDSSAHYDGSTYVAGAIYGGNANGSSNPTKRGGNILCWTVSTVTIHSGKITGGTAAAYGGNIHMYYGTLKIYGGEITGGDAATRGAQISLSSKGATAYIYGGTITGNGSKEAYSQEKGNLYIYGGNIGRIRLSGSTVLSMYGGNIEDINNYSGTVTLYNGVFGGFYNDTAPDTYLAACACAVTDEDGTVTVWHKNANDGSCATCAYNYAANNIDMEIGEHTYEGNTCSVCGAAAANVAQVGGNSYSTVSDALAAATSGQTVTLTADTMAIEVGVDSGVTLDLNGRTLTAGTVSASGNIINGTLIAEDPVFSASNAQLPVYYNGAYTFEEVSFKQKLELGETTATYKFFVDSLYKDTLIDDAILADSDVTIEVYVTWKVNGQDRYKTFVLGSDLANAYANDWDTKMIVLTINGTENITDLACTARVVSAGVTK